MANNKIKINVDLDFTSDRTSLEKVRDQIDTAIQAVEINLDPTSATKFKKDLEELGKYVERHLNKNTGKINAKNLIHDLGNNSDLKALRELGPELAAVGVHGTKTFSELTAQSNYLNRSLTESNSVLSKMGTTLMNTIRWNISASAVNAVTGGFQKMYYFAKDLDRTLTEIRIVSGQSADQMERFALHANESAKALRVSTLEYAQAATIFFQQGLGDADVKKMTDGAMMASRITGTAASDMADLLTSTMNGYKLAADEVMTVTDKLAAVGSTTASDFYELATGMSKVASMANTAGVSIDELNAQLATIVSVTRESPESIGTSLKTIYGRMLMFKTDTKALMKDEDGEVFGAPKVEEALQAYNRVSGAQISLFKTTADGRRELRDLGKVIEEIGDSWEDVTDRTAKFGLATALAGSRQQNRLVALFDSWDMYKDAVETSLNAEGTALKQNAIYMESYEGRLKGLQAAKEEMYMVFTDSDSMKGFISGLTKAVEMFAKLSEAAGGFNLIITGIGLAFSQTIAKKGTEMFGTISKTLTSQKGKADTQELETLKQLATINKVYGAEEANRLKNALILKKELLDDSRVERDLLAEEYSMLVRIGEIVKETEGAKQEGQLAQLMEENKHLGVSSERVRALQEDYQLLKLAEQELADLRVRAGEAAATDPIHQAIKYAEQEVESLKQEVDQITDEIASRKFEADKVVAFRENRFGDANADLTQRHVEAEKLLKTTNMIRTVALTLPVAIKGATDETKSFGDMLSGIALSTAPMLLSSLTKVGPAILTAAKGAGGLGAALGVAGAAVWPILAVGAAVAGIAVAFKKVNESTVTFAKSMKELEKASEELEEQERAYEDIEKQLQEIKNRRKEIALINKEYSTTDEEKEKLQEELDLLDIKYGRLEQELTIENMLLEVAKEKAEFAAKQAAETTMTSDYATSMGSDYGQVYDRVTVAEELKYATEAFVEADAQVTKYRETLVRLQADEDATARQIKKAQKDLDSATETRDKATDNIAEHSSAIRNIIKDLENEEGTNQELIDSLEEYLSVSTKTIAQTLGIGKAFEKASTDDFNEGLYETVDMMEELVKTFNEVTTRLKDYNVFLDEVNSKEGLSVKAKEDIIAKYSELEPYINNEIALRHKLIELIAEDEKAQADAYLKKMEHSTAFYNQQILGNSELVDSLNKYYGTDLSNFSSLADAKGKIEADLINQLSKLWAQYYNTLGSSSSKMNASAIRAMEKAALEGDPIAKRSLDLQRQIAEMDSHFRNKALEFKAVDFKGINTSGIKAPSSSGGRKAGSSSKKGDNKSIADTHKKALEDSISHSEWWVNARKHFDDWGADNEIAAWTRVRKRVKEHYAKGLIDHKTYTDNIIKLDKLLESATKDVWNSIKDIIDKQKENQLLDLEARTRAAEASLDAARDRLDKQKTSIQNDIKDLQDEIDKLQKDEREREENKQRSQYLSDISKLQNKYYHLQYIDLTLLTEEQAKSVGLEQERERHLQRQNELIEMQTRLQNLQKEKNIRQLTKGEDGAWNYEYVVDQEAIDKLNKEMSNKQDQHENEIKKLRETTLDELRKLQEDYDKWERKNRLQREIEEKRARIASYQDEIADLEENFRIKEEKTRKALQEERKYLDEYYRDINILADKKMAEMRVTHEDNWTAIGRSLKTEFKSIGDAYLDLLNTLSRGPTTGVSGSGGNTPSSLSNNSSNSSSYSPKKSGTSTISRSLGKNVYHDGGVVGSNKGHSDLTELINTMFNENLRPNERIIKALEGELMIPQQNIANNFVPNMRELVMGIAPRIVNRDTSNSNEITQIYHISKLEFPNVTSSREIEEAIINLPLKVKQATRS